MRRRSRASSKPANARSRKAMPKRRNATTVRAQSESAQLRRERDEALEREIATAEVLKVISSSPGDVKSIFASILENATRICEAKFGILLTYQNKLFRPVAHRNTPLALLEFHNQRGPFQPPRGTSLDQLLKTKDFVHRADDSVHQTPSSPARLGGAKSHLAVPMFKNRALVGAIMIYRQEVRPFTDKQIELVQNFAAQAVIVIENTRLLSELRQSTTDLGEALEQQTATADVLRVISSSPGDLEPVSQTMLENAVRICAARFGVLFLAEGDTYRVVAMHNVPESYREVRKREPTFRYSPSHPMARVAATRQMLQIADLQADASYAESDSSSYRAMVGLGGARTMLLVPMLRENEFVGQIAIFRQEVLPFSEKQIELVQNFAAQAVIAIENARLLNELRESLDQQT